MPCDPTNCDTFLYSNFLTTMKRVFLQHGWRSDNFRHASASSRPATPRNMAM